MEKLDLNGVRIYSNTKDDAKGAIDLIGEVVYLSDDVDFRSYRKGNLTEVNYANGITYPFFGGIEFIGWFKYLIRAKDAKFKKELRPFKDLDEFRRTLGCAVGNIIHYREKGKTLEFRLMFAGYTSEEKILLGYVFYSLTELFENYEYCDSDGKWLPFGIEE